MSPSLSRGSDRFATAGRTNTDAERAAATRVIRAEAKDENDQALLLDILGLAEDDDPQPAKPRTGRPPVDHGHGHYLTYGKGCRCDACREANRKYCAELRVTRAKDPSRADRAGHGLAATYKNYGCRCAPCTQANTDYTNAYRARHGRVPAVLKGAA